MKKGVFLTIVFSSFFLLANSIPAEELIGRVNEWPPYYFQQNGKWIGSNVDAYMALGNEAGVKIDLQVIPWSRAMAYMAKKPVMIGQLTPTDERRKIRYVFGPQAKEELIIAISKKYLKSKISSLDDLVALAKKAGKNVAYQKDVYYTREFHERIENDPEFRKHFFKMAKFDTVFKMVEIGRLLGYFESKISAAYDIKSKQQGDVLEIHPFIVSSSDVYLGVSKTISDETLKKLQEANERLLANGV